MENAAESSPPAYEKVASDPHHQASSSSKAAVPRPRRPVTYTVSITCKASRSFSSPLPARLVAAHKDFDPSLHPAMIRVITHYLHNTHGNWLYVGGYAMDQMEFPYVRVVVEVPVEGDGEMPLERKQELMARVLSAVQAYEGRKARETEVDVILREIRAEDELWARREVAR